MAALCAAGAEQLAATGVSYLFDNNCVNIYNTYEIRCNDSLASIFPPYHIFTKSDIPEQLINGLKETIFAGRNCEEISAAIVKLALKCNDANLCDTRMNALLSVLLEGVRLGGEVCVYLEQGRDYALSFV